MDVLIGGLVVLGVVAVVAFFLLRDRTDAVTDTEDLVAGSGRVRRPDANFHVVAKEARVAFDVPLPPEGVDPVLRDLLLHQATELLRDRIRRQQPLEDIELIRVYAKRAGEDSEVGTIELTGPNELPEVAVPMPLARTVGEDHDPLRALGDDDAKQVMAPAESARLDQLAPIGTDLKLTAGLSAGLRSLGIDPARMTVVDLGLGLLQLAGYSISERGGGTFVATGGGSSSFVRFVEHEPGSYPELESGAITEFLVGFSSARTDRGLLITDKFGPYEVYEKERSNPSTRFVTRERLQGFVDSVALS